MAERISMAETNVAPVSEVSTNDTSFADKLRVKAAKQVLVGTAFTEEQEQAVLKAHYEDQLLSDKARTLKGADFSKEQRRTLVENYIVGVVPPSEFASFKPEANNLTVPDATVFIDPKLLRIAQYIKSNGDAGQADEDFFSRTLVRIERLVDDDTAGAINYIEAQALLNNVEGWRRDAKQRPEKVEQRQGPPSRFDNILTTLQNITNAIRQLESQPPSLGRDAALDDARNERERFIGERDYLLEEANKEGLFDALKEQLFKTYYDSRVEVTYRDKVGDARSDGRGPGVLRNLDLLLRDTDPQKGKSWEVASELWSSPRAQEMAARLGMTPQDLERNFGGIADYFNRENLRLIRDVVQDRKRYLDRNKPAEYQRYPNSGVSQLWRDYTYVSPNGEPTIATDFEDIRGIVERERHRKPSVPNRGDYESWLALVAEDTEEAEELIPYIVGAVEGKLEGDPEAQLQTIQQESDKWAKAIDYLRVELHCEPGDPRFRRLKTMVTGEIKLMGVEVFAGLVNEDWNPFLKYESHIARMFKDTKYQDHMLDTLVLDKEGLKFATLELLAIKDWEFYRFGPNNRTTNDTMQIEDGIKWQQERHDWIENWLVSHELRPMADLLNIEINEDLASTLPIPIRVDSIGDPNHPAFQRLKKELDDLDATDPKRNQPDFKSRWQEYIEKAAIWERTGQSSDPRDKKLRVIFQHPLARAFRSKGFVDSQNNVTDKDEFWTMFRKVPDVDQRGVAIPERVNKNKRQRVQRAMASAERLVKFSMADAIAGGPRHVIDVMKKVDDQGNVVMQNGKEVLESPQGRIILNPQGDPAFLEITPELRLAIKFDTNNNPYIEDIVPHEVLVRKIMHRVVNADSQKPLKRRVFKFYHLFKKVIGIDLAQPATDGWYWGAHDTNRPHLLKYIREQVPEFEQMLRERAKLRQFDSTEGFEGYGYGGDAKTALTRVAEDERRVDTLVKVIIRELFSGFYNYPGHDDDEGGVKEFRNLLFQEYGISQGTVEVNSMIRKAILGQRDILHGFGAATWGQFIGLLKGPSEVVYARTRGFFASPRDAQNQVKRIASIVEQAKLWTGGGKEGNPGALNSGFVSGAYNFRALNRDSNNFPGQDPLKNVYPDPFWAHDEMKESGYRSYVDTAVKVVGPMMAIMEARQKLETNYGKNPQTAMFLNTLLWYQVCRWMDENPEEFRRKFGFAYDVDLPLARLFMNTALYESRLIYSDVQWDQIMLGYTIPKDQWDAIQGWDGNPATKPNIQLTKVVRYGADSSGNTLKYEEKTNKDTHQVQIEFSKDERTGNNIIVEGEIVEGLIDTLPADLRELALKNKWLPVGINSSKPESLEKLKAQLHKEGKRNKEIFEKVLDQAEKLIQPRRSVVRL